MTAAFTRTVDAVSLAVFRLGFIAVIAMIAAIAVEVFSRYALGNPTIWAFDVTYMLNGALLMSAVSWTLRQNGHVRIDILDRALGPVARRALDAVFYILFCTPILGAIAYFGVTRAWRAFTTSQVEVVSPWQPLIWPFQTALAIGLVMLTLQCLAEGLKRMVRSEPPPSPDHPEGL